jgi:hypothetical protein
VDLFIRTNQAQCWIIVHRTYTSDSEDIRRAVRVGLTGRVASPYKFLAVEDPTVLSRSASETAEASVLHALVPHR